MRRTSNQRHTPNVKPVEKVELSERHARLRFAVVILLVAIAMAAFGYGILGLLNGESGWTQIEASGSAEMNCSEDFTFQYNVGASGISASAEKRVLIDLFSDATVKTYQLFNADETNEELNNICYMNQHPNEEVQVDPVLYDAFSKVAQYGNRGIYLAAAYEDYENLFLCADEAMTYDFDPFQNEDVKSYLSEIAAFASDPSAVNVELLGDDTVKLSVSEEYLAYAKANAVTDFIDFGWMKNAFIADYIADVMIEEGHTLGAITSVDGFTRNLDDSGNEYGYTINDIVGKTIYPAASMNYTGARSIVYLHNYPTSDGNAGNYFEMKNGEVRSLYVDPADGLCKTSVENLVCYSNTAGCADILLEMAPLYISEAMDLDSLTRLTGSGIYSLYGQNQVIYYNEPDVELGNLYENDEVRYSKVLME